MSRRRTSLPLLSLIVALALALAGCGGGGSMSAGNAAAGAEVFADNCATCHGDQGEGAAVANLKERSKAGDYDAVVAQVTNGGYAMPAFGDRLTDQQINDVAAYVSETIAPKA